MMMYELYKPNGRSNYLNIGLTILICSITAILLGWLYCVIAYIPIVYFNFIITVGFGFAMAFSIQIVSKFLKIKDKRSRLLIIIIVSIIGYYSHWVSFIVQTVLGEFPSFIEFLNYWIYPRNFFDIIGEINHYGTWSIGFSENLISGLTLTLIWLVEMAIIFFISIGHIYRFPENPFSEKLNKWYPKIVLKEEFESVGSANKFISKLKQEGIDLILNFEKGLAYKYAKISIFYLEGEDIQYLSIDNVFIEVRNQSKKSVNELVKPIAISTSDAKKLITNFDTEKEFYLDF